MLALGGLRAPVILLAMAAAMVIIIIAAAYTLTIWNARGALTCGRSTPTELEAPKEPWRESWPDLPTATTKTLRLVTDPEELRAASLHHDRLELITGWYVDEGPKEPLTVNVDTFGRARLSNGYHRSIIGERLDLRLPVKIKLVERIGGWSAPVGPFLLAITNRA